MQTPHSGQPDALDWNQYDCAACGCVYRYHHPNRASERDEAAAEACPQCGLVPVPAAARHQSSRQLVIAVFGGAVAFAGLWIATAGRMTPEGVAYLVAWAAVVLVLFHLAIASMDPNSYRARNLRAALRHVSAGRAQVLRAARVRGNETPPRTSNTGLVLYLSLAAVTVVIALAPVAVAGARGCRGNPVAPKMVGPDRVVQVPHPVAHPLNRPTTL
jgi:hypothetical protein